MRRQLTHFSIFFILFCLTIPYHCSSFSAFIASFGPIAFLLLLFYTHHYLLVSFLCVFCMLPWRDPATILLSIFTSLFGFFSLFYVYKFIHFYYHRWAIYFAFFVLFALPLHTVVLSTSCLYSLPVASVFTFAILLPTLPFSFLFSWPFWAHINILALF